WGLRATARVCEVAPHTVLQWLVEAAEPLQACTSYCLCDVHMHHIQLDELYAVIRALKKGESSEENASKRLERSRRWVWPAIAPESKLLLVMDAGARTWEMAQCVVQQVVRGGAPDGVPLVLTDGLKESGTALLTHFGSWRHPEQRQAKGPMPPPRWM